MVTKIKINMEEFHKELEMNGSQFEKKHQNVLEQLKESEEVEVPYLNVEALEKIGLNKEEIKLYYNQWKNFFKRNNLKVIGNYLRSKSGNERFNEIDKMLGNMTKRKDYSTQPRK